MIALSGINSAETIPADAKIADLNKVINTKTKEHRQEKWLDPGTKKLWAAIKGIDKPPRQPENQSIKGGVPLG